MPLLIFPTPQVTVTTVCRPLVGVTVRGSVRVPTRVTHAPTNAAQSELIQV